MDKEGFQLVEKQFKYLSSPLLTESGRVNHAFSTRHGGLSTGYCSSLNFAFHTGDKNERVLTNRRLFFGYFGYDYRYIVSSIQVHGSGIKIFDSADRGEGALPQTAKSECDALITQEKGLVLTAYAADCLLLYVTSRNEPLAALIHAGWQGTLASIAMKVVKWIVSSLGAKPSDLLVAFSPSICYRCYEIGSDLYAKYLAAGWLADRHLFRHENRYYLDIAAVNRSQLLDAGISNRNIANSSWCTSCNPNLFYSYRRDKGKTGRMIGFIANL